MLPRCVRGPKSLKPMYFALKEVNFGDESVALINFISGKSKTKIATENSTKLVSINKNNNIIFYILGPSS